MSTPPARNPPRPRPLGPGPISAARTVVVNGPSHDRDQVSRWSWHRRGAPLGTHLSGGPGGTSRRGRRAAGRSGWTRSRPPPASPSAPSTDRRDPRRSRRNRASARSSPSMTSVAGRSSAESVLGSGCRSPSSSRAATAHKHHRHPPLLRHKSRRRRRPRRREVVLAPGDIIFPFESYLYSVGESDGTRYRLPRSRSIRVLVIRQLDHARRVLDQCSVRAAVVAVGARCFGLPLCCLCAAPE
jgi:hypothetical protein